MVSSPEADYGPYEFVSPEEQAEILVDGVVYRFPVIGPGKEGAWLQAYKGINAMGGYLWEKEVRVLTRLGSIRHPALPRMLDGGYDESRNIAFVVTEGKEIYLNDEDALPYLRNHRAASFQQFALLCDGLAELHGQGLIHRNLVPSSVQVLVQDLDAGDFSFQLARFEMSTLISNLLRRLGQTATRLEGLADRIRLERGARDVAYFAPEKLGLRTFRDEESISIAIESDRSDVYSMGVLAWELFVDDLPVSITSHFENANANPLDIARELHRHMIGEMTRKATPWQLRELIEGMLDLDQRTRWSSGEVVTTISKHYASLQSFFEDRETSLPFLIAVDPNQSSKTLQRWGWVEDEDAESTFRFYEEEELRNASLTYFPEGATPHVPGGVRKEKDKAKYVLIGAKGVYFCALLEDRGGGFTKTGHKIDEVLYIKFPLRRRNFLRLEQHPLSRKIHRVEAIPWDLPKAARDSYCQKEGRPSWKPLLASVTNVEEEPTWQTEFREAFDWLLEYLEVELRSHEYPFTCTPTTATQKELKFDGIRDEERISHYRNLFGNPSDMLRQFVRDSGRRKPMGDFFEDIDFDTAGPLELQIGADDHGNPRWQSNQAVVTFVRYDPHKDVIVVDTPRGSIPESGWVRKKSDIGSALALHRQFQVRREILGSKTLVSQLNRPRALESIRQRWSEAGSGLLGDAPERIRQMLSSQSFYALHGPPGTGKTTVTAHAVENALAREPTNRLLVSAQSHFALDNLALRIRKQLDLVGDDIDAPTLAVRVRSPRQDLDRVHPKMQDLLLENLTPRVAKRIEAATREKLKARQDSASIAELRGRLLEILPEIHLELQDRLKRGANLVFCTCVTATKENLDAYAGSGVYDWVIIEEAAKAWITELAIPMVRGVRWTLIGDHLQLSAHRREEVGAFLEECGNQTDFQDLQLRSSNVESMYRWFDVFDSVFSDVSPRNDKGRQTRPTGSLRTQFRMREPIANVVRDAFYKPLGYQLSTDPSTEIDSGVVFPEVFSGVALVWVDTEGIEDCDDSRWENDGEAEIVSSILNQLQLECTDNNQLQEVVRSPLRSNKTYRLSELLGTVPSPHAGEELLAVLSPYRKQLNRLSTKDLPSGARNCLYSIHEFQGREANIVVTSMVKTTDYGFLTNPEITNVLCSRARRLLIIVGRLSHFERCDAAFWPAVCSGVRKYGKVVHVDDLMC